MEVLKPSDGLLTNAEVYELINQNKKQRPAQYSLDNGAKVESKLPSSHYLSLQNREFVENETLNYLKQTNTNLNSEAIKLFIRKLKQLDVHLTETELVQLANHQPSFPVEVHIVSAMPSILK